MKYSFRFICMFLAFIGCTYRCSQKSERPLATSLEDIYRIAEKKPNIRSLLIVSDDKVVAERYFQNYNSDSLDHIRSATKSVMSLLIGIAIDRGIINSVNDRIAKYIDGVPEDKKNITIKHLLNMKSGITWDEGIGYNDNNRMVDSGNPLDHMMKLAMTASPGTTWEYSTGDIHLLSVVLTEASGMSTRNFAEEHLFGPLGIKDLEWQVFGDGYVSGGSRLQLKPRDMLKIGIVCMNNGQYQGRQIVSASYLNEATGIVHSFMVNENVEEGYGYGFWTINVDGVKGFMASGYGGQTIAVIPDIGITIVVTCSWRVSGEQSIKQQSAAQDIAIAVWEWKVGRPIVPRS